MRDNEFTHLMYRAYIRDGELEYSGEALLLACLVHTKGKGRGTQDEKDVQKIMHDRNIK